MQATVPNPSTTPHLQPSRDQGTSTIHRAGAIFNRALLYVITIALSALFLFPFFWTVTTSLKKPIELIKFPPTILPETPQWITYTQIWGLGAGINFGQFFLNSAIITSLALLGQIISAFLVGYGFARFRFPGREVLFAACLSTLILPPHVTIIPLFVLFRSLHWIDTFLLYLKIRWWWAIPSRIEVQLYCHSLSDTNDAMEETLWREYLLPHLVGDDVTLLTYLWDKLFGAPTELLSFLTNYAESRWTDHQVAEWRIAAQSWHESRFVQPSQLAPPFEARNLWANGIVTSSVEHGIELHPAIAALFGYHQAIYHRLWRGQASLLLPLLDQTRLTLCSYLTRSYGSDWPLRWDAPRSREEEELLGENPLACEWGHLYYLLENCGGLKAERKYASLAKQGRDLRNRLAHYRPVGYTAFRTFWQEQAVLVKRA